MAGVESTLETLISRGWFFRDPDQAIDLVRTKACSGPEIDVKDLIEMVESELLDTDLRSIGGKSLPDPTSLKRLSHLQGPKVLQVVSTRDVYRSSIDVSFQNSNHSSRLLKLILTDGNSEITAIEYTPIPVISDEIAPGSKVRLENKITLHNGIICLNKKTVMVLGGVVESLYEGWQLEQKYSSISRANLRPSNSDGSGPPPFEKLQLEKQTSHAHQQHGLHINLSVSGNPTKSNPNDGPEGSNQGQHREKLKQPTSNDLNDMPSISATEKMADDGASGSISRAKEVIEIMPIQNQAASQKLLQKMVQPSRGKWAPRGRRHRGNVDDAPVFTLEEWESQKAGMLGASRHAQASEMEDVSHDEEIARQLQRQLDLEDLHVHQGNENMMEAEKIKMSMFKFQQEEQYSGSRGARGRGRGRGRGMGRGRRFS